MKGRVKKRQVWNEICVKNPMGRILRFHRGFRSSLFLLSFNFSLQLASSRALTFFTWDSIPDGNDSASFGHWNESFQSWKLHILWSPAGWYFHRSRNVPRSYNTSVFSHSIRFLITNCSEAPTLCLWSCSAVCFMHLIVSFPRKGIKLAVERGYFKIVWNSSLKKWSDSTLRFLVKTSSDRNNTMF